MLLFIGGPEIIVILLFIVIFFGSSKIPSLARSLGKTIREVKDASNEIKKEIANIPKKDNIAKVGDLGQETVRQQQQFFDPKNQ